MAGHRETDETTGVDTTGHEWDGIRELDNPLPRWWLYMFWAGVAVAVVYWVLLPAWPALPGHQGYTPGLLGVSDRDHVVTELAALKAQRGAQAARLANASLEEIERDPQLQAYALSAGASIFGDNCATCHGTGGTGGKGYPDLRDDVWLWGNGSLEDIRRTIEVGVRSTDPNTRASQMPAFGRDGMLQSAQIADLTEYVWSLSGHRVDQAAAGRGSALFAEQCAACHGTDAKGNRELGAPDLTDADWLYRDKDQKAAIRDQIWNGRGGVMPTWGSRFDPATIKALAVYIHANADGK